MLRLLNGVFKKCLCRGVCCMCAIRLQRDWCKPLVNSKPSRLLDLKKWGHHGSNFITVKCQLFVLSPNRVELVCSAGEPLFFNTRGGPFLPTLRMLHKCTWERSKVMSVSRNQTVTVFGRLYACSLSVSYVQKCVPILIQNNPHTNPDLWPQNPNRPESAPENGGRCRRHQV